MAYFVDEAGHKVEGRLRRGITITFTGLSLVLSRADIFVRLQNRLGLQIFLVIFINSYLKCVGHQLFFKSWASSAKNNWCEKTSCNFNVRNRKGSGKPVFLIQKSSADETSMDETAVHCKYLFLLVLMQIILLFWFYVQFHF